MLKRWISGLLILVFVLTAAVGCGKKKAEAPKEDEKPSEQTPVKQQEESLLGDQVVSIALFGVDTLNSSMQSRSDMIIIVSLDKKAKEIRLSAIQRDAYVEIDHPKRGKIKDKLNHAFAYGGGELSVKTINANFGLNIKDYAVINFTNLEKLVDALGGLDLEVTANYRSEANHHIGALASQRKITPKLIPGTGMQHLNGMQVLGMLRCRKQVGGTGVRCEMNQKFLAACVAKLKQMDPADYPAIAKTLIGLIKTSLSAEYITGVATEVLKGDYKIRNAVFPLSEDLKGYGGTTIKGTYYMTFNPETTPKNLQNFINAGKIPKEEEK